MARGRLFCAWLAHTDDFVNLRWPSETGNNGNADDLRNNGLIAVLYSVWHNELASAATRAQARHGPRG